MKLLDDELERADPLEYKGLEQPFSKLVPYATKADIDKRVHGLVDYPD